MHISEETSQKIKNMSIVCAVLVVALHVDWPHETFSFNWMMCQIVQNGISRIAVPFFFVVSGFLLSKHMSGHHWYRVEVKKRIFSLVIPFVVWTLIATIVAWPHSAIADIIAHRPLGSALGFSNGRWMQIFGIDLRQGPACLGALWYVRCLFIFVLISPVLKRIVTGGWRWVWFTCAFLLTLMHQSLAPFPSDIQRFFVYGFSLSGVFYFTLGMYVGLSSIIKPPRCFFLGSVFVGIGALTLKVLFDFFAIDAYVDLVTIAIPFIMYSFWCLTPNDKWSPALTACSFPVFLMHLLIMPYALTVIKYSPLHDSQIERVLVFVIVLLFSFIMAVLIRKFFPRTNAFLFAGRG